MRKFILPICLLLAMASAAFTAGPQDNCTKDCAESLKACLSQTPATDQKQEQARIDACYERDRACRKSCGGRSPR
jgi:hypothetical protein